MCQASGCEARKSMTPQPGAPASKSVKKAECLIVVSDTAVVKLGRGPTWKSSSMGLAMVLGTAANEEDGRMRSASANAARAKHWMGLDRNTGGTSLGLSVLDSSVRSVVCLPSPTG